MAVLSYYVGPWHGTVPLATALTPYNLQALLLVHAEPPFDGSIASNKVSLLTIQFPFASTGGYLYIGNRWLSATDRGSEFVPGMTYPYPVLPNNPIILDHVWIMSDTNTQTANITLCRIC